MNRTTILGGAAAVAVIAIFGIWYAGAEDAPAMAAAQPVDLAEGKALYAENCAACHGANLEGQPDWQSPGPDGVLPAPPHSADGHTWHHPDNVLFQYTKLGGKAALADQGVDFASGMPGFGNILTDQQIWNILGYIKSTWPDRERAVQADRSEQARQQGGN